MSPYSNAPPSGLESSATRTSTIDYVSHIQLAELLGSGRHGMVFRGTQRKNGSEHTVAVKVPSHPEGLKNEQHALMRFEHANVIELLCDPLPNGALVLEYCDLGTLADRLSEETLGLSEVGDLLDSLIPALAVVHDQGWIHGDVSPGNIGLRRDRGPVLIDFETARPADGSAVDEGTAEFAGPLRQADPRLDIRSLAATTLRSLGDPDRWDHRKRHVQDLLNEVIEACDLGASVGLDQLQNIASIIDATSLTGAARMGWSGDGPDVHSPTRAFGPRPTDEASTSADSARPRRARLVVLSVLALAIAAITLELTGSPAPFSSDETAFLARERPASETLMDAGAQWNTETGVLTMTVDSGSERRFAAGDSGDLAAIADWSCDGQPTLGIYRPSTRTWFVFSSWEPGSSADISLLESGSSLAVRTDGSGCAEPQIN